MGDPIDPGAQHMGARTQPQRARDIECLHADDQEKNAGGEKGWFQNRNSDAQERFKNPLAGDRALLFPGRVDGAEGCGDEEVGVGGDRHALNKHHAAQRQYGEIRKL